MISKHNWQVLGAKLDIVGMLMSHGWRVLESRIASELTRSNASFKENLQRRVQLLSSPVRKKIANGKISAMKNVQVNYQICEFGQNALRFTFRQLK